MMVVAASLVSIAVGSAWIGGFARATGRLDREQLIEVLYSEDPEATYVGASLEDFAHEADLNLVTIQVDNANELLQRIFKSKAALLVVAAHGLTTYASDASGVRVGTDRVTAHDLWTATEASGAGAFLFAACGLDLPESSRGRPVTSFDGPIDMKIAALSALSTMGDLYEATTIGELVPPFLAAIDRLGTGQELFARMLDPMDPLDPPGYYYDGRPNCYRESENCEWSADDEQHVQRRGQSEGGALGMVASYLTAPTDELVELGVLKVKENVREYVQGQLREYLLQIKWDFERCRTIFQVENMAVPGYSGAVELINQIPGVKNFQASAFAVELCGTVFIGFVDYGQAAASGELRLQGGTDISFVVKFGWFKVTVEFWAGLVGELGVEANGAYNIGQDRWELDASLAMSLYLTLTGKFGWRDGTLTHNLAQWERDWHWTWGAAQTSTAGPLLLPGASHRELLADEVRMVQRLTVTNLNALAGDATRAHDVSEALGTDVLDLPPGAPLDLGVPAVCHALYGGDAPCVETNVRVPASNSVAGPLCVEETTPSASPFPSAFAAACAEAGEEGVSVSLNVAKGASDLEGTIAEASGGWADPHQWSPMGHCIATIGNGQDVPYACYLLAGMVDALPHIATDKVPQGISASLLVDLNADDPTAVVVEGCVTGLGVACLPSAGGTAHGVALSIRDAVTEADLTLGRTLRAMGVARLCDDLVYWASQGSQENCQ